MGIANLAYKAVRRVGEPVSLNPTTAGSVDVKGVYAEWLSEGEETDTPTKMLTLARPDAEGMVPNESQVDFRGERFVVGDIAYSKYATTLYLRDYDDSEE